MLFFPQLHQLSLTVSSTLFFIFHDLFLACIGAKDFVTVFVIFYFNLLHKALKIIIIIKLSIMFAVLFYENWHLGQVGFKLIFNGKREIISRSLCHIYIISFHKYTLNSDTSPNFF